MSLRAAIVGCGSSGTRRARALLALGIDEIAVTDKHRARAEELAAAVGGDVAESVAAAAAGADAVLVCTPPASRALFGLAAVRQGAHVFVEAPISDRIEEVGPLLEGATAHQRVLMVGSRLRFHPGLERIRALLAAGTLGRVYAVSMCVGTRLALQPWEYDAGCGSSVEAHQETVTAVVQWFDALRWLFGKPAEVTSVCGNIYPNGNDCEEPRASLVRMESGAVVQVYNDTFRGPEATRIQVAGTDGTIDWAAAEHRLVLRRLGGRERREEHMPADENELDGAELRHFFSCVLTGRNPAADGAEGRAALALALSARRAGRLRRTLAVGEDSRRSSRRRGLFPALRLVHAH